MSNISDKDLDRLSREAAEYYEPEDSGLSWKKLEQRLVSEINDKPPASSPSFGRGPIVIGSLVLLLTGVSYFLIKTISSAKKSTQKQSITTLAPSQGESTKQSNAATANQSASNKESQNQAERNSAQTQSKNSGNNNESVPGSAKENEAAANKSATPSGSVDNATASQERNNRSNQANIEKNNKNKNGYAAGLIAGNSIVKNNGNKTKSGQQKNVNQSESLNQDNLNASSNKSVKSSQNNNAINGNNTGEFLQYATLPGLELKNNHYPAVSDASLRKYKISNTPAQNDAQKNQQSLHINRALKIGVMYAPDYTTVRSGPSNGTSNNFGITIGYEFVDRWSVNTGLIYTKKNYGADWKDFHAILNSWAQPDYVKGNCEMWEIPLTLRYDFARAGKNSFFANAGLSTYLMRKEEYTYYGHGYYNGNTIYWSNGPHPYANRDLYLLSIASVSAGIEHQFGKGFSLQVEPFMKIPLIGVGLGSLQMNSYGVSFSLRYAPVLNKTRH